MAKCFSCKRNVPGFSRRAPSQCWWCCRTMAWFEGKSIMEYSGRSFEDVERYMLRDFVRQSKARWPKLGRGVARLVKHFHSESANQWELLADFTPRQLSGLNELLQELSLECVGF